MLNLYLLFYLMNFSVSVLPDINTSYTWTDITSSNFPFSYFLKKMNKFSLLLFRLHLLTKYFSNIISHNSTASTFTYINFPRKIKYYFRNSSLMIPKSIMPSVHSIYISTSVLGCRNAASTSHNSAIHPSSLYYRVNPIRILVGVSDATGDNDSVKSTPKTCIYSLTTFIDFRRIKPPASSLILNTHLTEMCFLPLDFANASFRWNPGLS